MFEQLTISELQDIFAIQQKLMAQMESLNITTEDLQNQNWAEFDIMLQQEHGGKEPTMIPTTKQQEEVIRKRAENSRSRSRQSSRSKKQPVTLSNHNANSSQQNNSTSNG